MGQCFSCVAYKPGKDLEKTQVRFSAGLETLLRDADLRTSSYQAPPVRKKIDRKLPTTPTRKSVDGKPSIRSIRRPVDGKHGTTSARKSVDGKHGTTSARKSVDRKLSTTSNRKLVDGKPSTKSTRKSLVGNSTEEYKAEAAGVRMRRENVGNNPPQRLRWQPLGHLLRETRMEFADGGSSTSRDSQTRPPATSSPKVYGDDRTKRSAGLRWEGRKSAERKSVDRRPVETKSADSERGSVEKKSVDRKSVDRTFIEKKSADRKSFDKKSGPEKRSVDGKAVDRKVVSDRRSPDGRGMGRKYERGSGNGNAVEASVAATNVKIRRSLDRVSGFSPDQNGRSLKTITVDKKSLERRSAERKAVDPSVVTATNIKVRRSVDRSPDLNTSNSFSPDHNAKSLKTTRARNGYSSRPRSGNLKVYTDSRQSLPVELDFVAQRFVIDNYEQIIQARIDGESSEITNRYDPAADSRDSREDSSLSAQELDDFTKSCKESAAKAAARDLDAFKSMSTSIESS